MKRFLLIAAAGVSMLVAGCSTTQTAKRPPLTGDPIVDGRNAIDYGKPEDRVLWQYRTAAAAMRRGDFDLARRLLDDALLTIGGINANDKSAKKARSYFHAESKKTFHGEPYERVMAYYYRGILYWMDGELDNARACFRSAQLEDADAEHNTYRADYVLLDYLDGFVTAKFGSDASEQFERAKAAARNSNPPPYYTKANVMVFLEWGRGPGKYATGQYAEQLRFRPGQSPVRSAVVKVGSQKFPLVPYDDLTYQATTRGGRVMDHILGNKANFKTGTSAFGDAAIVSGAGVATLGRGEDAGVVGLALVGAGLVSKIVSGTTTPEADTRAWDNLPNYLSFAALELPPGEHTLSVDFLDGSGRPLLTRSATFTVPPGNHDVVLFFSDLKH